MIGKDVVIDYTNEDFNNSNPLYIFGAPYKMELANKQNYFNCGVESTLNTLIMGGKMELGSENQTEKNFLTEMWTKGYCDDAGGFYGNGRIEHIYTKEFVSKNKQDYIEYEYLQSEIVDIAENVAAWLSQTHGDRNYTSAFEAIQDDAKDLSALIYCYTNV